MQHTQKGHVKGDGTEKKQTKRKTEIEIAEQAMHDTGGEMGVREKDGRNQRKEATGS